MKIIILSCSFLFLIACGITLQSNTKSTNVFREENMDSQKINPTPTVSPSMTPAYTPTPLNDEPESLKFSVYSVALTDIVFDSEWEDLIGRDLIIKRATIPLSNIELIKSKIDSTDLVNDLINKNETSENLRQTGYDVYVEQRVISGKESLETIFIKSKIKYKDAKIAVGLSKVGVDERTSQALVYVEVFTPEKQIAKRLCLFSVRENYKTTWISLDE